jgi:hypothetical protein
MADVIIGPVLKDGSAYRFDIFVAGSGLSPGYPYRRIEDAYYARNVVARTSMQNRMWSATVCQTLDDFLAKSTEEDVLAAP